MEGEGKGGVDNMGIQSGGYISMGCTLGRLSSLVIVDVDVDVGYYCRGFARVSHQSERRYRV